MRAWAGKRLAALTPQARRRSDEALFTRFLALPQAAEAPVILLYCGMGSEPDTARLIPLLLGRGHRVALPRCLPEGRMEARLVGADTPLFRHPMGMLEPGPLCLPVEPSEISLTLTPGLAFDPAGGRLGRGGGFYDRWLSDFGGITAALCRACVLVEAVPRAPHDLGVDLVVTEDGVCRSEGLSPLKYAGGRDPKAPPSGFRTCIHNG